MNEKIIRKLFAKGLTVDEFCLELKRIEATVKDIRILNQEKNKIHEDYKQNLQKLKDKIESIQDACEHISFSYVGDPSGNNDDYNECDICKKVL